MNSGQARPREVYGWVFTCPLGVDDARVALSKLPGWSWQIRESEHLGRYLSGTDARGLRVRFLGEANVRDLEVYLSPALCDDHEQVHELLHAQVPEWLACIGAHDVRRD